MENMKQIDLFIAKMKQEQLSEAAINSFIHYYSRLCTGDTGLIPENTIDTVAYDSIDNIEQIQSVTATDQKALLSEVVCIKLNGGLGTTMGLQGPKSLIPVKEGLSFLDITAKQICSFNKQYNVQIPLILMNSFRTEADSQKALLQYPELTTAIPNSFVQNKFPKVFVSSLEPASYEQNPELEWNPPGHGDLYITLETSGILDKLISSGYRYAFISNIDNLGATLDPKILSYIAKKQIPFLMEVTKRTYMDRKGGHLAQLKNGKLTLREAAQCPNESSEAFMDISRYCYFNTNNLWIDLAALRTKLNESNGFLDLPMIRNRKKLNPLDKQSSDVYQVESAMGTAISVFDNSAALRVPRSRFAPVKNCEDLLLLWSDAFILDKNSSITSNPERKYQDITIKLDPEYYSFVNQLQERFPYGAPSLLNSASFTVKGDFLFGKDIAIQDSVILTNHLKKQISIPDQTLFKSNMEYQ